MGAFQKLFDLCDRIKSIDETEVFVETIKESAVKTHIIYLNAFDQLFLGGLNADGEIVGRYALSTQSIYEGASFTFKGLTKRKIRGDAYFFYDKGGFLKSFSVSIKKNGFTIVAQDEIEDQFYDTLTEKFGKSILGLTNESKSELGLKMLPTLRKMVRSKVAS